MARRISSLVVADTVAIGIGGKGSVFQDGGEGAKRILTVAAATKEYQENQGSVGRKGERVTSWK